jgi:hypothetical protein
MVLKSQQKKKFLGQNLEKSRLSIRVRNFAPLNEPLDIYKFYFYFNPEVAHT